MNQHRVFKISTIVRSKKSLWKDVFCLILLLMYTSPTLAVQTETLPETISTASVRYGQISGLEQRFTEDNSLVRLTDYKSIEFDAETLARFNPEAATLIETLNRFGLYNAGDLFNLGTLEFETTPTIQYMAPLYARGLTKNWTLAVGIPIVNYKNDVNIQQSFSNIAYYDQFRGLDPALDAALDTDLGAATQNTLIQKGYKPIVDRDESFVADLQMVSIWKFYEGATNKSLHQLTLNLPTGPKYDTDDLLALNAFGKTYIENSVAFSQTVNTYLSLNPYTNFRYYLPEKLEIRVPENDSDVLPDESSKENLTKYEGYQYEIGGQANLAINDDLNFGVDYRIGQKVQDSFSKADRGNSQVLATNTDSNWHKVGFEMSYSTVKSYLSKKSLIPMNLSFLAYDTISGKNVERRIGQELSIALFF